LTESTVVYTFTLNGKSIDISGICTYTVSLPASAVNAHPKIKWVYLGDWYMPENYVQSASYYNDYNQACNDSASLTNLYGLAIAEQRLDSGYCNTDYTGIDSSVQAVNTNLQSGFTAFNGKWTHKWVQSYLAGTIFYGVFTACLENPVGQYNNYECLSINQGPLFPN
jgi:hypothetical protein